MEIFLTILFLIIGFALLVKGADFFVDGACGLSLRLKIPAYLIGITVVAFGTSLPEAGGEHHRFNSGKQRHRPRKYCRLQYF